MPNSGYFDVPFAVDGDLTPVPDGVQPDGSVSYSQGYGPDYEQDPAIDPLTALEIERSKMNQLFNDITTAIQNQQQNTIAPFITTAMNNGSPYSYNKGALVFYGGIAYQSLQNANTDTPPTSKWQVFDISLFLQAENNLSDVASKATSLTNLGFNTNSTSWLKFPNPLNLAQPLIAQWGTATTTGGGSVAVTFPIPFPNNTFSVLLGLLSTSPVNAYTGYGNLTLSGMNIFTNAAGAAPQLGTVSWLVIGK